MSIFVGRYAGVVSGGGATRAVWAPYFTAAPVILGVLEEGATLAVSFGIAGRPSPSISIQWFLNWAEIDGATTNSLTCPDVVGGDVISCTVALANGQGTAQSAVAATVGSGAGLAVVFGEGAVTVTAFGAVAAPSVVFGDETVTVNNF